MSQIFLHHGDLPAGVDFGACVAIDTETMGLSTLRDRLCLVQLSAGDGTAHLVKFDGKTYNAPNLVKLLADPNVVKLFHFARFDLAALRHWLGVMPQPVWCTKIASKMVRTFTDRHGLKDLCNDLISVSISKQEQSSDWGAPEITAAQQTYAASDVLHLHRLRDKLTIMLEREGRMAMATAAFAYLPHRAELDLAGWADVDIFAH